MSFRRGVILFVLTACTREPAPPPPQEWRVVVDGLESTLLCVWGTSEKDVWAVGGPLGNSGFEALVLRFDGASWKRLSPGGTESFWWVHGSSPNDVWLVGERGRTLHWTGAGFTEVPSGVVDATLFGVWASAPDDVWAVGGNPDQPDARNDLILHWDGRAWSAEHVPEPRGVTFFKVWGATRDDLYVVGAAGTIWHRVPKTGWRREAEGLAGGRLTTVAGCSPSEIYAVGGRDLLVSNGTSWIRAPLDPLTLVNDLNGVSCGAGRVVVVGGGSLKLRLVDGAWVSDFGSQPFSDLHGAWVDRTGASWAVGGDFSSAPRANGKRRGVVARFAADVVSGRISP